MTIGGVTTNYGSLVQNNKVKLYYHHDRQGSDDFLTDNVKNKVASYISYDEWGNPEKKAILKCGTRELDLVTEYTGHPYDAVLSVYYAKARMYDAADRRFLAVDFIKGSLMVPMSLTQYTYCLDNPLKWIDPLGLISSPLLNIVAQNLVAEGGNKNYLAVSKAIDEIFAYNPVNMNNTCHIIAQALLYAHTKEVNPTWAVELEYITSIGRIDMLAVIPGGGALIYELKSKSLIVGSDGITNVLIDNDKYGQKKAYTQITKYYKQLKNCVDNGIKNYVEGKEIKGVVDYNSTPTLGNFEVMVLDAKNYSIKMTFEYYGGGLYTYQLIIQNKPAYRVLANAPEFEPTTQQAFDSMRKRVKAEQQLQPIFDYYQSVMLTAGTVALVATATSAISLALQAPAILTDASLTLGGNSFSLTNVIDYLTNAGIDKLAIGAKFTGDVLNEVKSLLNDLFKNPISAN
ncbi:MAG: hypothetical protein FWD71_19395 [Oscillospiraceae bacterium]|nr:hypothetical protein [Oscillospiraceae bacterium]